MTAADYAHDQRSGNSQGLHYSTFEPPSKKRAHARSTSCSKKIFPRCANPPSWARVERMNLSLRHFTRRLTRSTLGFSRTLRNQRHALTLFIAHFNFCRTHSSLKNGVTRTP